MPDSSNGLWAGARQTLARIDVRLTVLLAGATAAFTSALLCGLLAYAITEAFEEQVALVDDAVSAVGGSIARRAPVGPVRHDIAYRVTDAAGREIASHGTWPVERRQLRSGPLPAALVAGADDFLVRDRRDAENLTVEAALPLRHFARERRELVVCGAGVVVIGLLGAVILGWVGARRALLPLREATAAIRAIDAHRLDARIPLRDTADDVDQLAMATNEVLARLEWAFQRLSAFSADVAHQLRTPVNRILNAAEVALTTASDAAGRDEALATVVETAEAMRRTVDHLLLLSKGEEGRLRLASEPIDLAEIVAGLVEFYAPLAERSGQRLSLRSAPVTIDADRQLVVQAVANLVENAVRHAARGATIRVGIEATEATAAVVVEDSGPGIAPADRDRVFRRFVRLDGDASGGAGLGLPIVRMIARLHHGDVEVGRSSLGGAAFRLVLATTLHAGVSL